MGKGYILYGDYSPAIKNVKTVLCVMELGFIQEICNILQHVLP